ncbi:MAG: hypothetical protein KGH60_01230 [Candidatus Micrarchaeota archaeon]|nr:hypothetical protein [Candidatus Micrarchaeota archaeon]
MTATKTRPSNTITYRYDFAWLDWSIPFNERKSKIDDVKRDVASIIEKILKIDSSAQINGKVDGTTNMALSIFSKDNDAVEAFSREAKLLFAKYKFHYSIL